MADARHACPHCDRQLGDANALYRHVKAKHGRKLAQPLRPQTEREPSMGELVADAMLARACGEPVDPIIAEMFDV